MATTTTTKRTTTMSITSKTIIAFQRTKAKSCKISRADSSKNTFAMARSGPRPSVSYETMIDKGWWQIKHQLLLHRPLFPIHDEVGDDKVEILVLSHKARQDPTTMLPSQVASYTHSEVERENDYMDRGDAQSSNSRHTTQRPHCTVKQIM